MGRPHPPSPLPPSNTLRGCPPKERRLHTVSTNEIRVWHITESEKRELSGDLLRHFFSGETYVVRWYYHVTATGRTLKVSPARFVGVRPLKEGDRRLLKDEISDWR